MNDSEVKIIGVIDRVSNKGEFKEERPQIIFSTIIPSTAENPKKFLFDDLEK